MASLVVLVACAADPVDDPSQPVCEGKCDGGSTASGRANLYANLLAQMDHPGVLFGQERFNITGVTAGGTQWLASAGHVDRSDARTVAGDHPVVMGFDGWDLAQKPERWSPTPAVHAEAAKAVHRDGGIVELAWHMHGCAADTFNAPGNEACLCKLANDDGYARSWLVDANLKKLADALVKHGLDAIPIVFRPLHEHTGNWFWWGEPYWACDRYVASPRFSGEAAFQRVFRTIVTYLRVERGLGNLLVAYSPAGAEALATEAGYLRGYPGDEYVDILGADLYYQRDPSAATQSASFRRQLQNVTRLARARGKVAALTEVGDTQLASDPRWYTEQLLPLLDAPGVDLAYALTWENRTSAAGDFWVPFEGQAGASDFRAFAASATTSFQSDAPAFDRAPSGAYPVCQSCSSDPDGDRWGWEHEQSCRVGSWCLVPEYPICARCDSDPDGDGWGWEHERSCEVLPTCR